MNKKAIWIIIGLMSAALIGIVLLQMYWIRWSIQLNESQFDKNIYNVLNRVSEKLQSAEELNDNLKVLAPLDEKSSESSLFTEFKADIKALNSETSNDYDSRIDSTINRYSELYAKLTTNNNCQCSNCQRERTERFRQLEDQLEKKSLRKFFNPTPISDRIVLNDLDQFLKNELVNRGISIDSVSYTHLTLPTKRIV